MMNKPFEISFLSSYIPRQCGIATFTSDLANSIKRLKKKGYKSEINVTALNDIPEGYKYPSDVKFEVKDKSINDFKEAAYYLNLSDNDIINIQHEFGLYGGDAGSNILYLLENLKKPVVTTLHTVIEKPNEDQLKVIKDLGKYSSAIVVQSCRAFKMLEDIYDIHRKKISYIPHGAHDVPFLDTSYYKDKFQLLGKKVILTFGLLSGEKGIEDVIEALNICIKDHPETVYIVLGTTHPNVKRIYGEAYRNRLENIVKEYGLENNVIFINRFVDTEELLEFLLMADIYISPYHNVDQIVSGTLTYALASGKAIISTPYWYAEELLKDERGVLVPFRDPEAMAAAISDLLDDELKRNKLRKNAYDTGRSMLWEETGKTYIELFRKSVIGFKKYPASIIKSSKFQDLPSLPEVNLSHLKTMTDSTGIIQHATYSVPNRELGYCLDDNARALLVAALNRFLFHDPGIDALINTYLTFVYHAYNPETGLFRNFMSYDRKWLEDKGSEDANGRTIFVLGYFVKNSANYSHLALSKMLFEQSIKNMYHFNSVRSISHIAIGCMFYLLRFSGASEVKKVCRKFLASIYHAYETHSVEGWRWFENYLTYSNARISQAMLMGGGYLNNKNYISAGLESLEWLFSQIYDADKKYISIIGNESWYYKGKKKSEYDQQPIEIPGLIDACFQAYTITQDKIWIRRIGITFSWFLGNNKRREPLYDFSTGGCFDGLTSTVTNQNQGAESTISWLLSLHRMYRIRQELQIE